jgi:hypothetical protein
MQSGWNAFFSADITLTSRAVTPGLVSIFMHWAKKNRLVAVPLEKIMVNDGNDKGPFLPSIRDEDVRIYASRFQNRPECSFGHSPEWLGIVV